MRASALLLPSLPLLFAGCASAPSPDITGEAVRRNAVVTVCHVSGHSVRELSVDQSALSAHLGHGDSLPVEWYEDQDGDGYGDAAAATVACENPDASLYTADSTDCDDGDATVHPDAAEACDDGIDDNCDGQVDEGCTAGCEGAELVHAWAFDGDALDGVGASDFTRFGSTSFVPGYDGQALRIDWQGGGAWAPDLLSQFGTGAFTLSVWVNYHGDFAGHARHEHIFFSTDGDNTRDVDLFAERAGGQTYAWTQGHVTSIYSGATASWIGQQDAWHHVALGRDDAGNQYLCEDGVVTGSGWANPFQHSSNATFYLGRNSYENGGRSFPGALDDFRVYDGWVGAAGCAALDAGTCE